MTLSTMIANVLFGILLLVMGILLHLAHKKTTHDYLLFIKIGCTRFIGAEEVIARKVHEMLGARLEFAAFG
jgi:hypothetical protein